MLKDLTEALACHEASCRPPTSGGTGGSSASGIAGLTTNWGAPLTRKMLEDAHASFITVRDPETQSGYKAHVYADDLDGVENILRRMSHDIEANGWGVKVATNRFFELTGTGKYPTQVGKAVTVYLPHRDTWERDLKYLTRLMEDLPTRQQKHVESETYAGNGVSWRYEFKEGAPSRDLDSGEAHQWYQAAFGLNASAVLTEAFACHDASCRPPTSGGTGGSRPMRYSDSGAWGNSYRVSSTITGHAADIMSIKGYVKGGFRDPRESDRVGPHESAGSDALKILQKMHGANTVTKELHHGLRSGEDRFLGLKPGDSVDIPILATSDSRNFAHESARNPYGADGNGAVLRILSGSKSVKYTDNYREYLAAGRFEVVSIRTVVSGADPRRYPNGTRQVPGALPGTTRSEPTYAETPPTVHEITLRQTHVFNPKTHEYDPLALSASAVLTEALACHEASCRPPTSGGTGGSSPSRGGLPGGLSPTEDGRVRPESKLRGKPWDEMERTVWGAYTGDLGNGYKSQVDESEQVNGPTSRMLSITGTITNVHGREVGQFERTVYHKDGKLVVVHDLLTMDDSAQGRGVGAAFNARAVEKYKAWGVDRIEMDAGYQVGGYAWAVAGFRVRGPGSTVQSLCGRGAERLAQALRVGQITQEQHDRLKTEIDEMYNASWRGVDVQPIHIASWGRDVPFKQEGNKGSYMTWPGKEALLGSNWSGVYYFDAGAVTASAESAEEFYSPTQPRDREGQWTAFRSSITSLSRDTLDRAIEHGADGIFGAGQTAPTPWPRFPKLKGQRPYDPDLVAAKLREPPVLEKVDPRALYSTQPGLVRSHVDYYTGSEYHTTGRTAADQAVRENRFPIVYVRRDGRALILTGHHRAAAALVQGKDLDAIVVREP